MPEARDGEMTRERATALYTFLKEFTELRTKTTRTVDQYEQVLWFSDVPHETECDCAAWHRGLDGDSGEVWLSVRQPRPPAAPRPPADLEPWLVLKEIADSSIEMPTLRDEISIPILDESGEQHFQRQVIGDRPEIKALWEHFVESDWWPWAEADRRAQAVQRVYTQLFTFYQMQQRLGEQYELVLGLGLLSWRTPDQQDVRRHLIAASASVAFDAARGLITVGPAGEGAKPEIEQDMLDPTFRPDPDALRALESAIAETGEQLWNPAPIDSTLASWVHFASPTGIYDETLSPPESVLQDPRVHLAPALILRKRTDRSFLRAFADIIQQIKDGSFIPPGVDRFVTVSEEADPNEAPVGADNGNASPASELYFPLEWNDAQKQIIERLSRHQGVLVQGPPGTGKSHTIVNLICHLLSSGQRVLITSHTARALKVIQRYIITRVPEISPLAVVLLGDDRYALQAMEDSVQGITNRHNHWDQQASLQRIAELEGQLDGARREEARVRSELRAIRERETYAHPPCFGAYEGTLRAIATRIRGEEAVFHWFTDRPPEDQEPPLSAEQLQELISLLRDPEVNEWDSSCAMVISTQLLPPPDAIAAILDRESQTRAAYEELSETRSRPEYLPLLAASPEVRQSLQAKLTALLESAEQVGRHLHTWANRAVREIVGDHDRAWRDLFEVTQEHLSAIGPRARWADETPVSGLKSYNHHEVRADAEAMLAHLADGRGWGVGPFRAAPAKQAQYIRREIKIGGHAADNREHLGALIAWLDIENRLSILRDRWSPFHTIAPDSAFSAQVRIFEDLCEPLEAALGLHASKAPICADIHAIPGLPEPIWHELNSLRLLRECLAAVTQELCYRDVQQQLLRVQEQVLAMSGTNGASHSERDLVHSLEMRDARGYREAFAQAIHNECLSARSKRRETLWSELRSHAPIISEQLGESAHDESWDNRAAQFGAAWNWARAGAWIERLCDPEAEQQLRLQLDSARDRIRNRLKDVAAEKAWTHCFSRMTEHQRQHLVAWSKAMRSVGKGTGKYAAQHRRNAREHMNECRSAIPAWVMPLYRVAETIKPGRELFDVVIVDEASQSGPEALLLAYLAKKLVVVGDDKQISPTYAGINFEDVNHIRARHLSGLPHADSYGVHQSFFDLAEIRYQGRIRLREHFRCMPEIIQFSNSLCYSSEPLIPLRQYGSSRLSPVVSVHYVPDGYLKGSGQSVTNPPEAQAVVGEILRMHADKCYAGKTFGVISLLGQSQAREIEALLLKQLGPQEMNDLQLVCGDAYAFQGDERDVVLLSLVSAPDESRRIGTLADEAARRRFNVAVSRAKDQLVLFHTATLNDLSPLCLRYSLLQYCQNPTVERLEYCGRPVHELQHLAATADRERMPPPEPFESWFELDVFLRIVARGYRVLPQYEVAGYRIDLVVDGMDRRMAVECDGDRWHGPDQYEQDMTRQRMLERSGWRFFRVRASAFSLNPEAALEDLWNILQREGVYPSSLGLAAPMPAAPEARNQSTLLAALPAHDTMISDTSRPRDQPPLEHEVAPDRIGQRPARIDPEPLELMNVPELGDAPFTAWTPLVPLPDPTLSRPADLIPGLLEIVGVEGPLSADRLCGLFVRAAGHQRVGRQLRSGLNKAIWKAIRDGLIEERNEAGPSGPKERVLRRANSPSVVVRPRGNRDFLEIPPSEVATVMCRLERQGTAPRVEILGRAVLDFYEIRRMTKNIHARLQWILDRRRDLLGGDQVSPDADTTWRLE